MASELTYTYKDNPYPKGTKEHDIWYQAFVHGLNSATKSFAALTNTIDEMLKTEGGST